MKKNYHQCKPLPVQMFSHTNVLAKSNTMVISNMHECMHIYLTLDETDRDMFYNHKKNDILLRLRKLRVPSKKNSCNRQTDHRHHHIFTTAEDCTDNVEAQTTLYQDEAK